MSNQSKSSASQPAVDDGFSQTDAEITKSPYNHSHGAWEQPVTDLPLRRDVRMLGFQLGHVLRHHGSNELYQLVERVRQIAKNRRAGSDEADDTLRDTIAQCSVSELAELARALTCFFDLTNLAEDRHRIRVLRQRSGSSYPKPREESPGAALVNLAEQGMTAEQTQAMLDEMTIDLVFTAHPTEAKRRTIRNTLKRLRLHLIELDRTDLLPNERDTLIESIKIDLDCLWETDTLRPQRPTVLGEVKRSLFVFNPLWDVVPRLYSDIRQSLKEVYPDHPFTLPPILQFGTWIGGDRDGNPFVTHEVTAETLLTLRKAAIDKHIEVGRQLYTRLSISTERHPVGQALLDALQEARQKWPELASILDQFHPQELYRHYLRLIEYRLHQTQQADPLTNGDALPQGAYHNAQQLIADLKLIQDSLLQNHHPELANGPIQDWLDRTAVFGFHFAHLDVREDSQRLAAACGELSEQMGLCQRYDELDEAGKQALLAQTVSATQSARVDWQTLSPEASETLKLFMLLHRAGKYISPDAFGCTIASMTQKPSDVLTFVWLGRLAAYLEGDNQPAIALPIVPLFETIDDLVNGPDTLRELWANPTYLQHLKATGNKQVVMVGYSDSTKDGGYLASNWALYDAQQRIADLAESHNIAIEFFHGRGGALGRGGGPAARGITSLPPKSVDGRIRITEQGEVLAERYDDPEIAYRHLEQVTWATLNVSGQQRLCRQGNEKACQAASQAIPDNWCQTMQTAGEAAKAAYRNLRNDDAFIDYFEQCTPIRVIESLAIGSRPARRRTVASLANLRAIPYTFSWNQTRHSLTGFYGIGSGLVAANDAAVAAGQEPWAEFKTMYQDWPFFRAIIDNAELALAKSDLEIAHAYADLADNPDAAQGLWMLIRDEYWRTVRAVMVITDRKELLDGIPWLQRSVRVRNPYVDPINFIQVELLRRKRLGDESPELLNALRLTVQGIAAGLRTTG